jgi:HSP20 family molecular chaperone IbpA
MPDSPPPEERARLDKEAKAKEDAEQAALPYKWTQTIKDVDITVAIAGNLKGRDLDVKLTKTKLKVAIKGQDPIIDVYPLVTPPFHSPNQNTYSCIGRSSPPNPR